MADELTPEKFDQAVPGKTSKLWGLPVIARFLGVSEGTVRNWSKLPDVPIYSPLRGTYFAYRSELEAWLRGKAGT